MSVLVGRVMLRLQQRPPPARVFVTYLCQLRFPMALDGIEKIALNRCKRVGLGVSCRLRCRAQAHGGSSPPLRTIFSNLQTSPLEKRTSSGIKNADFSPDLLLILKQLAFIATNCHAGFVPRLCQVGPALAVSEGARIFVKNVSRRTSGSLECSGQLTRITWSDSTSAVGRPQSGEAKY